MIINLTGMENPECVSACAKANEDLEWMAGL